MPHRSAQQRRDNGEGLDRAMEAQRRPLLSGAFLFMQIPASPCQPPYSTSLPVLSKVIVLTHKQEEHTAPMGPQGSQDSGDTMPAEGGKLRKGLHTVQEVSQAQDHPKEHFLLVWTWMAWGTS